MDWYDALDITVVWITILWAMKAIWPHHRWIALAQIPYLIWVTIASVLQFSITLSSDVVHEVDVVDGAFAMDRWDSPIESDFQARCGPFRSSHLSTVLPGFLSKLLVYSMVPLPRWARISIMGNVMRGMAPKARSSVSGSNAG